MTTRDLDNSKQAERPRDPDFVGAEMAIQRAAGIARRRAIETLGSVAVFKDGRVVWETADGTLLEDPEQNAGNPNDRFNGIQDGEG